MKQIIIGIHGLGNKPPRKLLKKWWLQSIHEGLARIGKEKLSIPFNLVYWADVNNPVPLNPHIRNTENPLYLKERYRKGVFKERNEKSSLRKHIYQHIEEQLDKIFLNDDLSINFKNVTEKIIHRYFSDLETYYTEDCESVSDPKCSSKAAIHARLLRTLEKYKGYKVLLIAHSMGSIAAFDVLSNVKSALSIHTLVTIGSPLGLPVIVSRIFAEQKEKNPRIKKPHVPESITAKWFNMSDIEDKVALDHTLADDYGENSKGLLAEDIFVDNDYEIDGEKNPHKSFGYLRTFELASIINDFLTLRRRDKMYQDYKVFTKKVASKVHLLKNILKRRSQ